MGRVMHFEVHAGEPERAMAFYGNVLGWTFKKWDGPWPYWMIFTGPESEPGINGGLMERRGGPPEKLAAVNASVCTAIVDDVDATSEKVVAHGGLIALPKMTVPGVGWLAYYKDTEGNLFGVLKPDEAVGAESDVAP